MKYHYANQYYQIDEIFYGLHRKEILITMKGHELRLPTLYLYE
jgi:hypothetical protein